MGLRKAAVIHEPHSLKPFVCTLTGKIIPTKKHRAGGGKKASNELRAHGKLPAGNV